MGIAHADESAPVKSMDQEICDAWMKSLDEKNTPKTEEQKKNEITFGKVLGVFLRLSYAKPTVVKAVPLSAELNQDEKVSSVRFGAEKGTIYSVGLSEFYLQNSEHFEADQAAYAQASKQLRNEQKLIHQLISKAKTMEACLNAVRGSGLDFEKAKKNVEYLQANTRIKMEQDNQKIAHTLKKQDRRYLGLNLSPAVTIDVLSQKLKTQTSPIAILALHASEDGKLYDSNWNFVPRSVFLQMSRGIHTLVIYSCHAESVIERYRFKELSNERDLQVIYPQVGEKVKWLFGDSVPVQMFGTFLKQALARSTRSHAVSVEASPKTCNLKVSMSASWQGEFGVMLNQTYIGLLKNDQRSVAFDCALLRTQNTITLQGMNLFQKPWIPESVPQWELWVNDRAYQIKHFYDQTHPEIYVGSKLEF